MNQQLIGWVIVVGLMAMVSLFVVKTSVDVSKPNWVRLADVVSEAADHAEGQK